MPSRDHKSSSPPHPDPEYVGRHLVLDKTDLFPETPPEQLDARYRCILCSEQRSSKDAFPDTCEGAEREE